MVPRHVVFTKTGLSGAFVVDLEHFEDVPRLSVGGQFVVPIPRVAVY